MGITSANTNIPVQLQLPPVSAAVQTNTPAPTLAPQMARDGLVLSPAAQAARANADPAQPANAAPAQGTAPTAAADAQHQQEQEALKAKLKKLMTESLLMDIADDMKLSDVDEQKKK